MTEKGPALHLPANWFCLTEAEIDVWRAANDPDYRPGTAHDAGRRLAEDREKKIMDRVFGKGGKEPS